MDSISHKIYGVVITYRPDLSLLEKCVNSLYIQCNKLLIIDNTPDSYTALEIFRRNKNIEIIYLNDNYGIAYAQNLGIRKALEEKADYILLSDQDTVYPFNFVEKMLECFKDEMVSICGPMYFDVITKKIQPFIRKGIIGFKKFCPANGKHYVLQVIASGSIIKSKHLNDIGLFNESLFIDWVDLEWCWRAVKKGYKIIANADVVISHKLGENYKSLGFRDVNLRNYIRYYYIIRNASYLALHSDVLDVIHRIILFLKSLGYIIGYTVLSKPHIITLKYSLKGFYDGITKKLGKLNV